MDSFQTFFLAGTLIISSSAIIGKILDELNITHQRTGQLAMGVTVVEDIVAVVMLTLFLSTQKWLPAAPQEALRSGRRSVLSVRL